MSTRPIDTETSRIGSKSNELRKTRLALANSIIEFETGPVGAIAKIVRSDGSRDYAGPLPPATIDALREVSAE